ncbi:uncharacterized protein At2g33490-like isoform X2 [Rutidosis leptorrhynchoides]|uniref:uncharacterized protein At2g33490-like isoform X2 n=1 Tax=Rutidosis leptorrhynchoides TaxID=125765 RepID=UPI003A99D821
MKSPLKKLRGGLHMMTRLNLHHHHNTPVNQLDELSQASQDLLDMKDCYDSLLSSAAATTNSAYEFSESLREMGDCLLEKTSLNDDEDTGRALLMLGKVQFQIQKLVDSYRSHISQTITVPSESLLNELRIVEDMKKQCDDKRMLYDEMKLRHKDRKWLGSNKGDRVSSNQVRAAHEAFEDDATLFVFRMKSLKGGQSRSLLTQAARHHAAQMCFFRKALNALETIEPHVQSVAKSQHIDYQFSGLEDDDRDSVFLTDEEDEEDESDDEFVNGELSFDYQRNNPKIPVSSSEHSIELNSADLTFPQVAPINSVKPRKPLWNSSTYNISANVGSKSAPLSSAPKLEHLRQSSVRKLNTYVLPTPLETTPRFQTQTSSTNMWHSSPLEREKYDEKGRLSGLNTLNESNNKSKPIPLPSPIKHATDPWSSFGTKNVKRYAFSGPVGTSPNLHQSSSSVQSASFVSSPKISELHELPRPPPNYVKKPNLKAGFSAPLVTFKDSDGTIKSPKFPVRARPITHIEYQNLKASVSPQRF